MEELREAVTEYLQALDRFREGNGDPDASDTNEKLAAAEVRLRLLLGMKVM